jgi:hypothetical protein
VPQAVALQVVVRSHLPTQFTGSIEVPVEDTVPPDPLLVEVDPPPVTTVAAGVVSAGGGVESVAAAAAVVVVVVVVLVVRKLGMGIYFKYIPAPTDELRRESIRIIIMITTPALIYY